MGWLFLATQAENESVRRRPLILPQDIQRLSNDKLLVRGGHLSLFKLNRIVWHRALWFSRMRASPPEIAPTGTAARLGVRSGKRYFQARSPPEVEAT
jgi:type IV secretory pathway TraG/TraD family ATPase VirD4